MACKCVGRRIGSHDELIIIIKPQLGLPVSAPPCFRRSTVYNILYFLTPQFFWRHGLRSISVPAGFYMLFCIGLVKYNTVFKTERTSWVPSNQGRLCQDIVRWKQRTASVDVLKYKSYVVLIYRKPAVQKV